jgi:hypothetical protein
LMSMISRSRSCTIAFVMFISISFRRYGRIA